MRKTVVPGLVAALSTLSSAPSLAQVEGETVELAPVRIRAPRIITPLPGVVLDREQSSVNVQSATAADLRQQQSLNITDFLNTQGQSITVNDYAGNPFQQDLSFRGFSASPLVGTPQGLSVYLDGVRINEPFGEVVNWDLIPTIAIERTDLIPGSNPLFGLNTIGGALSLQTKSGFTAPRFEVSRTQGSWGRTQNQFAVGANNGALAGFFAANEFREDGWRDNSPSSVNQYFGRVDLRGSNFEITGSVLSVSNMLTGNGLVPYEDYEARPESVFTSPDTNRNDLDHYTLRARLDLSDRASVSAMLYRRKLTQQSVGGDIWDDFDRLSYGRLDDCPFSFFPYVSANGAYDPVGGATGPGCPGFAPNGLFNIGGTSQKASGLALQLVHVGDEHQIVLGGTFDRNSMRYGQGQMLGYIDADRNIYVDPAQADELGLAPLDTLIQRNNLSGSSETVALFGTDTWTVRDDLYVNYGVRWSRTHVKNQLVSDKPIPLYQFTQQFLNTRQLRCGPLSDASARYLCSEGDYTYYSTNPSFGISWLARPELNLFMNMSKGSRTPSVIELGCARDKKLENANNGKSIGCSVPTALTSDPYLPQVRSFSAEFGVRATSFDGRVDWNATAFTTQLDDDILFVSLGRKNRGVFDTFERTMREGFELGMTARFGRHTFRAAYTRLNATFESSAVVVNQSNSSANRTPGELNEFTIKPGDRIPGIPRDVMRLGWAFDATDKLNVGINMIAHAGSYSRGNENNEHEAGGTDEFGNSFGGGAAGLGRAYTGSGKTAGYAVFHFVGRYQITPRLSLFARIDNLFDKQYVTASELEINPFSAGSFGARDASGFNYNSFAWTHSQFVGPGSPRAGWFGLNYAFDMPTLD
ncbi:MAG: TonB-dependent receptor [Gammaproteobacteria bacterium]|nr:TonB-dependent receptor [Gammaproteobacteria bacterium]MBU0773324.1 TonB-dependent receptor [Gammaproteobacteria bacterium]MBU0854716.1 TonB-dependent receptor [Gammaproteobacteria bacterium]MBU1846708.1 TonB-dependent receptor [Gammaproteobacteria bacterium]